MLYKTVAIFLHLSVNSIMQTNKQSRTVGNLKKQHRKDADYSFPWG